jgi:hypothetical protein
MNVAITVYGKVVSIESTGPPQLDAPVEPPPPETPEVIALQAMRDLMPGYYRARAVPQAELREGEEAPKLWVHIHILLDAPHAGELQVNAPESQVGGLLVVDGRARVMVSSN